MGTLRDFITPYTDELTTIANELIKVVENFTTTDYQLGTWVTELSLKFHGQSANALNAAFSDYDMVAVQYIKSMEDGITALHSCVMSLQNQTDDTEATINDPHMILPQVMSECTLNDVAMNGGYTPANIALGIAHTLYTNYLKQTEATYSHGLPKMAHQSPQELAFYSNVNSIAAILLQWGNAIRQIITTFNASLGTIRPPHDVPMPQDNPFQFIPGGTPITLDPVAEAQYTLVMDPNQQNLARLVFSHYHDQNGKRPFGITNVGNNTILVTIAGLEGDDAHTGQANDLDGAITTGLLEKYGSQYTQDINSAILDYMKLHQKELAPGTKVILAGHSLGGMAAQLVAQQNEENGRPFNITNVITFGSPPMYATTDYPKVNYNLYRNAGDPVPNLSTYNLVTDPNLTDHPQAKQSWLDFSPPVNLETMVPDVGNVYFDVTTMSLSQQDPVTVKQSSWDPKVVYFDGAHGAYINSFWLGKQGLPFDVNSTNSSATYPALTGPGVPYDAAGN